METDWLAGRGGLSIALLLLRSRYLPMSRLGPTSRTALASLYSGLMGFGEPVGCISQENMKSCFPHLTAQVA